MTWDKHRHDQLVSAPVAILAADTFWATQTVMKNCRSQFAQVAMCPAERERDPPGCRASGVIPKLPINVVLVPPPVVP